jgi:hypothetical protein
MYQLLSALHVELATRASMANERVVMVPGNLLVIADFMFFLGIFVRECGYVGGASIRCPAQDLCTAPDTSDAKLTERAG